MDKCLECGANLDRANRGDNAGARAQMKWCSDTCKRRYLNRIHYKKHKESIIARIRRNRQERQERQQ